MLKTNDNSEAAYKKVFISPTSNVGFMKLFGSEGTEEDLKALLNIIFTDRKVTSIERLEVRHPYPDGGSSTFDAYCTMNDDSRCVIEMQNASNTRYFAERSLAYSAMAILDQARINWNYRYDRVYFIGLLNYVMFKDEAQPVNVAAMTLQSGSHHVVTDSLLQIFIEFPKFAKSSYDGMPLQEKLYTAMRDMHLWDKRPESYMERDLDWLFKHAAYNDLSDKDKDRYDKEMTSKKDYEEYAKERISWAFEDGRAKGHAEGRAEGRAEGDTLRAKSIAAAMKSAGEPVEKIVLYTGLSSGQIEDL